jgi:hypothetical protein
MKIRQLPSLGGSGSCKKSAEMLIILMSNKFQGLLALGTSFVGDTHNMESAVGGIAGIMRVLRG